MSTAKRWSLKGGVLALALFLSGLALQMSVPAPVKACTWMWGVDFNYVYSNGGECVEDCYAHMTCWGDTTGDVQVNQGECYYCG